MKNPRILPTAVCGLPVFIALGFWFAGGDERRSSRGADPAARNRPRPAILSATLPSCDAARVELPALRGKKATVFVCLSTECPISNGYLPALNRLREKYSPRGVRIVGLNPNAGQSLRAMKAHQREFDIRFPVLKDAGGVVASELGITACPGVCLLDDTGVVRYRGRIDDRYFRRGGGAVAVKRRDLEIALRELLEGKKVTRPETETVGCPIVRATVDPDENTSSASKTGPTYAGEISRLLDRHCVGCHRPDGIGPFSLATYQQAVNWAEDIRQFTADRRMPPWKPVEGHGDFINRRAMSHKEIELIGRWVKGGCPLGDKRRLPPPRQFTAGWRLGKPDLVLEPKEEFHMSADGPDDYRCFVLPTDFPEDKYVTAMEVQPGNARVVHHVIAFLDDSGRAAQLDSRDAGPGFSTSGGFPGFLPSGFLGGWAPGNTKAPLTKGMARAMSRGAAVVMQVHYHKTGKPEKDRTRLGVYFARGKVTRGVRTVAVTPPGGPLSGMRIPPGESNYEIRGSRVLKDDYLALGVTPHMHLLGKEMKVTATLPDGKTVPLVWVRDWDFNWQETYQYRRPLELPKGTRIDLLARYDNTSDNPFNPNHPPKLVRWGEQTTDEMCIAFLDLAPQREAKTPEELKPRPTGEFIRQLFLADWLRRWNERPVTDFIRENRHQN